MVCLTVAANVNKLITHQTQKHSTDKWNLNHTRKGTTNSWTCVTRGRWRIVWAQPGGNTCC